MAVLTVTRESDTTNARHVVLTHKNNAGNQVVTGADAPVITVDVNHQRNHDGRSFFAFKLYPVSSKLPNGSSIDIVIASPSGLTPHVLVDSFCQGDAELYIYEGTATTGGTSFTPINRNRNYAVSNPSQVAMVINPTITLLGTMLDGQIVPGGVGKKSGGGTAGSLEYVLKPLTNYLFRLTNVNGTDHAAFLTLEWYE
jgi:hypothetical protein